MAGTSRRSMEVDAAAGQASPCLRRACVRRGRGRRGAAAGQGPPAPARAAARGDRGSVRGHASTSMSKARSRAASRRPRRWTGRSLARRARRPCVGGEPLRHAVEQGCGSRARLRRRGGRMLTGIDHIVIVTRDLDAAIAGYRELGFTAVPGAALGGDAQRADRARRRRLHRADRLPRPRDAAAAPLVAAAPGRRRPRGLRRGHDRLRRRRGGAARCIRTGLSVPPDWRRRCVRHHL